MWIAVQVLAGLVASLVACFFAWFFFSKGGKRTRALVNLRATSVADLVEGKRTKIVGLAALAPGCSVLSPVSQRPVVAFQGYLAFWSPGLSSRHMPLRSAASFLVETSDGSVLVEASDAAFELLLGDTVRVAWSEAADWMDDLVTRDGLHFDRSRPKAERIGHYDMAEGVIAPGTRVAVLGVVARDSEGVLVLRPDPAVGMALSIDVAVPRAPD